MSRPLAVALRLAGTAAGLAWVAWSVDFGDVAAALGRIPLAAFGGAIVAVAANVVVGAVRWRSAMRAYGAAHLPTLGRATQLYFVSFFYNNYLPGAVAGDVGRGVVARDAFGERGATGALAVVVVERALGLFALFALLAVGLIATNGRIDSGSLWWWTALGCAGSCALVIAIALARRLAPRLPGWLGRTAGRLPPLVDTRAFAASVGWSLGTQLLIALAGWLLLAGLGPIDFAASLLIVPLAAATAFLPITVGGTGAREAVYVALGGSLLGLAKADALAASLGLWLAHLAVGAVGGVLQLVSRRR